MRCLRLFCRRARCGTWFVFSRAVIQSPTTKNISMPECSIVFSEEIAFVCIGSQFATVRTLLRSGRKIGADSASAGTYEVGEASIAWLVPPGSRRGMNEGRDVSSPLPRTEWWRDAQVHRFPAFEFSKHAPSPSGVGRSEPFTPAATQTGHSAVSPLAEFGANRLLARLLLHQARPRDDCAASPKHRIVPQAGAGARLRPDAGPLFSLGSEPPLLPAPAPASPMAPIETLLTELARRQLRSLVTKERAR